MEWKWKKNGTSDGVAVKAKRKTILCKRFVPNKRNGINLKRVFDLIKILNANVLVCMQLSLVLLMAVFRNKAKQKTTKYKSYNSSFP